MTGRPNDGGPAFPLAGNGDDRATGQGMSLLDWFAGQALAAGPSCQEIQGYRERRDVAEGCYLLAAAMMQARALYLTERIPRERAPLVADPVSRAELCAQCGVRPVMDLSTGCASCLSRFTAQP
jgi:hypothetical protein